MEHSKTITLYSTISQDLLAQVNFVISKHEQHKPLEKALMKLQLQLRKYSKFVDNELNEKFTLMDNTIIQFHQENISEEILITELNEFTEILSKRK